MSIVEIGKRIRKLLKEKFTDKIDWTGLIM